jgi:hypothetical protein
LINHSRACPACGSVLDEFRALDEHIRERIDEVPIPDILPQGERVRIARSPLFLWIPIIAGIAAAIILVALLSSEMASRSSAAPLFAITEEEHHPGWLILSSEQEVMAFDLERGERRRILDNPAHDWWNPMIISPDAGLVVRWEEYARGEERAGALRAYDMQGNRQYLHRWFGTRTRIFSGWLDDRIVLFAERGPIPRAGVVTSAEAEDSSPTLIAAALETGHEWAVHQGPFDRAVPSPDGAHLAIVRPGTGPWPGKRIEIRTITDGEAGDVIASLEHRHLSWPGRMVWSPDSQQLVVPAISSDEVPDPLPQIGDPSPGSFDIERIHPVVIDVSGEILELETTDEELHWVIPQAVHPESSAISVVYNEARNRDDTWYHGIIDLSSGDVTRTNQRVPGSRWWNSESIWRPDGTELIVQHYITDRFGENQLDEEPETLVLSSLGSENTRDPLLVFQDAALLNLRPSAGLGILLWVSDEKMSTQPTLTGERPRTARPVPLAQAGENQHLFEGAAVAATGRHILLQQSDPEAESGARNRLLHLQAWAGTDTDFEYASDFTWLPRETAVIGASEPDSETGHGSRIVFAATDRSSQIHGMGIDPAGIGEDFDRIYRHPMMSPNGAQLAFLIDDLSSGEIQVWVDRWNGTPEQIDSWSYPGDQRTGATLILRWVNDRNLLYTQPVRWDDRYPVEIALKRASLEPGRSITTDPVRTYRATGRDRGIEVVELEISSNEKRLAIRLRHTLGSSALRTRDTIHVSPVTDTNQSLEVVRADSGEGMTWIIDDQWLIAGIDDRIALIEASGRHVEHLTDAPAAFPVSVNPGEVWYQDLSEHGKITRITFD